MTVRRHADAHEFLAEAGTLLRAQPVHNQLPLAIAHACVHEPGRYGPGVRFYSDPAVGAAVQTPPWFVQLAAGTTDAATRLGQAFARDHDLVAGVAGPDDLPTHFAAGYAAVRSITHARTEAMGLFALREVAAVPGAPGRRVVAGAEHGVLLQAWYEAFHAEATADDPAPRPGAGQRAAASGRVHLWLGDDDEPVAMAVNNREVEGWSSIGPVYTPPARRGHGYATSLVAGLSQHLLELGRVGCTLFTNLANPTSNAIYERIGYARVGQFERVTFTPRAARPRS